VVYCLIKGFCADRNPQKMKRKRLVRINLLFKLPDIFGEMR
jgi:hypothetical protein